jgi:hypothetical protein
MALTLTCPCGAAFDVEDTFAGQTVSCPECQSSVKAPALRLGPRRTSGFAIASLVLALVGACTPIPIGPLAAVVCGLLALVTIGRSRGRLAGAGLAVFGMVLGVLFTAVMAFAVSRGELFGVGDQFRKQMLDGRVDFSGPLEIVPPGEGFKITRPSDKWGVAKQDLVQELNNQSLLMLVNTAKDAYVDVTALASPGRSLDQLRQSVVTAFKDQEAGDGFGGQQGGDFRRVSDLKLRDNQRLPDRDGCQVAEIVLDVRVLGQPLTYLIRVVKEPRSGRAFQVRGWTSRRRFVQEESDLREVLDSFHVLPRS